MTKDGGAAANANNGNNVAAADAAGSLASAAVGGREMDKSWRLIAVGGGAPMMKVVGRAGALAALAQATVAPISHIVAL